MIEFHNVEINGPFRYLWLKYVTGHTLNLHCARCLRGEYSKKINLDAYREKLILLDEHPSNILYLCGVASPYRWENNFHLALREESGETFDVAEHGIVMTVKNAVPLPITVDAMITVGHKNRFQKAFGTCRNWQFANFLEATGIIDAGQ